MSYDEFKTQYIQILKKLLLNGPDKVGSNAYAEEILRLVKSVPSEWEKMADRELLVNEYL